MEIILAEHRGFCYGVTRAVEMAEQSLTQAAPICTLGPIIHNPQMVDRLRQNGIGKVDSLDEMNEGTIVIRSHGVGPQVYQAAADKNLTIVDATCPHVKKAQQSAKALLETNDYVVVIGEKKHPEVKSIFEWSNQQAYVVETVEEAEALPRAERIGVVSQTTFAGNEFDRITEVLSAKCTQLEVKRTICTATELRQKAAVELAEKVDIMIVIGGKNSANTTRLAELCAKTGCFTKHIETASELEPEWFLGKIKAGITAGASTPGWIIEEVAEKMETFEATINVEMKELRTGELVEGTVISIRKDGLFVDVGYKSEGFVPLQEVASPTPDDLNTVVSVGDTIRMVVVSAKENMDGVVVLSKRKAEQRDIAAKLGQMFKDGETLTCQIVQAIKGGLRVDVCGMDGFMPASQIDIRPTKDTAQFIGQTMEVKIIEMDERKNRIVVSRRAVLEKAAEEAKKLAFERIHVGDVLTTKVLEEVKGGLRVDIYGVRGFIPASQVDLYMVKDLSQFIGQELELQIIEAEEAKGRVVLSRRALLEKAAEEAKKLAFERIQVGDVLTAKVLEEVKGGLRVDIYGVRGFVPASQIDIHMVKDLSQFIGQELELEIIEAEEAKGRIVLSRRTLLEKAIAKAKQDALDRIHIGDVVEGTVRRIQDYGVFVNIGGIDALLHVSDMAWEKVSHPSELFKVGDTVKAVIVKFDSEANRIGLSLKKMIRDPWLDKTDAIKEGTVISGTVTKLTTFGAFVKIADDLEGLVRMSEISERHIKKAEEALSVGQEVKVKVLTIDKRNKKIALSIRQVQQDAERAEYKAYMNQQEDSTVTLGDQLGDLLKDFKL